MDATSATITAYTTDSGVGVNGASSAVYLDGSSTKLAGCTNTASTVSCPTGTLAYGAHSYTVNAWDYARGNPSTGAGNVGTASGSFTLADTIAPAISSITPTGYLGDAAHGIQNTGADVAVYFGDTGSGINTAAVSVYWHGPDMDLTAGCTVTATYASCPRTGLPQGSHNIDVSVADNAGNVSTQTANVFIDSVGPRAKSFSPRYNLASNATGAITFTAADDLASGDYYWPAGSNSGIDYSKPITLTLDGSVVSGCTVNTTTGVVTCPSQTGLAEGPHWFNVTLTDMAGNTDNKGSSFAVDTIAPSITGLSPSGTTGSSVTFSANYSDSGVGINTATAGVYLDGSSTRLPGCTATTSSISCSASGLAAGPHTYQVKVNDWARGTARSGPGNIGSASGSFTVWTCTAGKPSLRLETPVAYWGSYADYVTGTLSVDWSITNTGSNNAIGVAMTNVSNTNGITGPSGPVAFGDIAAGSSAGETLQYTGFTSGGYVVVGSWHTVNTATASDDCGTGYTYP
jgi:hypothetical protein